MSDTVTDIIDKSLIIPFHLVISLAGVVTNGLTMVIIRRLGFRNSMSVLTFALAATDFYVTLMELLMFVFFLTRLAMGEGQVDLWGIGNKTIGWVRYPGLFISNWVTTFISVERFAAVVSPFSVKRLFTKSRSIVSVVIICVVFICIDIPMYTVQYLRWETVSYSKSNDTVTAKGILKVVYTENGAKTEMIINTTCALSLTLLSQAVLTLCTMGMIFRLKVSSQVRMHRKDLSPLTLKERRLMKVAIWLAVLLTGCYVPRYVNIAVRYTVSSLYNDEALNYIVWSSTGVFISLNYSSNFFVYLNLNVKFKQRVYEMFSCLSLTRRASKNVLAL